MIARQHISIRSPIGGWGSPWPNVAEIAQELPHEKWTLVGGLMTQLHAIHHGIDTPRATNDVDIVLHIETTRGVAQQTADALERLGYTLTPSFDPRTGTAHRFRRERSSVDLVTSEDDVTDVVDVLLAEHAAPRAIEQLRGRTMITIDGGTQALKRTINADLEITAGAITTISVLGVFGALILKAAAYKADSRDRDRHLVDAAALLAAIEDPYEQATQLAGSDRSRLATLVKALPDTSTIWTTLSEEHRVGAQAALRILTNW